MFQFATFALHTYVFSMQYPCGWVSPFGNLRIKACLLAPRSLSQATTSFIACNRQGIHHVHLFACPYNVSPWLLTRERYSSRSTACCMFVDSYYYPKCALLHARLKKLYFFQIVKEQNNSDLEKIKPKSNDLRLSFWWRMTGSN